MSETTSKQNITTNGSEENIKQQQPDMAETVTSEESHCRQDT